VAQGFFELIGNAYLLLAALVIGVLASVTGLLADDPNEVGNAVRDLNAVVPEVQKFVAENREALGTTSDKLAGVTQALNDRLDDVKHVVPKDVRELWP